ncbi:hypothetical protein LguiB_006635 [Lonicera macranthoides]
MEHYECMVDLLGQASVVVEAVELIEGMSVPPDPVLWVTLLGACKVHGLVELGEEIAHKLIQLDPNHDGNYVQLASIYAKSKKWEDLVRIRRLIFDRKANKVPDWSLIESEGKLHWFVAATEYSISWFVEDQQNLLAGSSRFKFVGLVHSIGKVQNNPYSDCEWNNLVKTILLEGHSVVQHCS